MAYLATDQNQTQDPNQQQTQAGGAQSQSSTPQTGGSSGGGYANAGGVSTAGVGAGGQGGWTNIQAYMNANQGDQGSSNLLKNNVSNTFNNESQNINQSSQQAQQQGQAATDKTNVSQDQASQMLAQANQNYSYGGTQSDAYNQATSGLKGAMQQYSGPQQYSYGMGADAQRYGQGLGNDQGFQGMMGSMENQAAGGQMGSGQAALQGMLDTNNSNMGDTRNQLLGQYAGLQGQAQTASAATNTALGQDQTQALANQNNLRSYLTNQQGTDQGAINNAVQSFNGSENQNKTGADKIYGAGQDGLHGNQMFNYYQAANNGHIKGDHAINADDFYKYQNGVDATSANVGGVGTQRNDFNTISDVLGLNNTIGQDATGASHGAWNFDNAGFENAKAKPTQNGWAYNPGDNNEVGHVYM